MLIKFQTVRHLFMWQLNVHWQHIPHLPSGTFSLLQDRSVLKSTHNVDHYVPSFGQENSLVLLPSGEEPCPKRENNLYKNCLLWYLKDFDFERWFPYLGDSTLNVINIYGGIQASLVRWKNVVDIKDCSKCLSQFLAHLTLW